MPRLPAAKRAAFLPFLQAAMAEFQVANPAREAAFAAQLAHESGEFRFMEEIWGPTDAQRRYEPPAALAAKLGNTEPGDSKRFKGRGPLQITGRANYTRFGGLLGVDLIAAPERAAQPELAFRIAGLFWMTNKLNELADQVTAEAFKEITRRINGGFNGLADREEYYAVARTVLGVAAPPLSRGRRPSPASVPDPVFVRGAEVIARDEEEGEPPPAPRPPRKRRSAPRAAAKPRRRALKSRRPKVRASKPRTSKARR